MELQIGQRCIKVGGDYQHTGTIVAVFQKMDGKTRLVVEFDAPVQGMLHILKPEQILRIDKFEIDRELEQLSLVKKENC